MQILFFASNNKMLMGKKSSKDTGTLNVLPFKQYLPQVSKQLTLFLGTWDRSYLLKLLDPAKDIVFGCEPSTEDFTCCSGSRQNVQEKQVNRIVVTRR